MLKSILQFTLVALIIAGCAGKKSLLDETAQMCGRNGYSYYIEGNFTAALKHYQKALWHAGRNDNPLLRAQYLFNIGRIHLEQKRLDSAQQYFYASYSEFLFYNDSSGASTAAGFLALTYACSGNSDSAWEICSGKYGDNQTAFWNTVRARIYLLESNYSNASKFLEKAAVFYESKKEIHALALNCLYRATVAFSDKSYSSARTLLDSALTLLDKVPVRNDRYKVLIGFSALEFCNGSEEAGYRFYKRARECAPQGTSVPPLERIRSCNSLIY